VTPPLRLSRYGNFEAHRLGEDSVIHLGTSVRFRDLDNDADGKSVRYRQPPFFHFTSTRSVGTGDIADAENDVWLGGDAALVLGPFSLQGEAAHTGLQRDDATDATACRAAISA
jgi:phosphate-selective porin OprO and OprP